MNLSGDRAKILLNTLKQVWKFFNLEKVRSTYTSALVDVHQRNRVDSPCCCFICRCVASFHSLSTAAFSSGINIAWSERSVIHTLGFPRHASLKDRSQGTV